MKRYLAVIVLLAFSLAAFSQTNTPAKDNPMKKAYANFTGLFKADSGQWYAANTLDLTLSGTYTAPAGTGFQNIPTAKFKQGAFGMDVGLTYWATKNIGLGAQCGCSDFKEPSAGVVNYAAGDLYLRLPIGRFAPYVVGGAGRDFDYGVYFGQGGAGVQFAISDRVKLDVKGLCKWEQEPGPNSLGIYTGIVFSF